MDKWTKVYDAAENRIRADIQAGKRPNIADQLTLGTRFAEIEKLFENAYNKDSLSGN